MGRVGGDEEDGFAHAGHLDGEGAGGGGFADAAFAADEDPAEGLLGEEGGEGGGEGVGVEDGAGHGGWWFLRGWWGGGCEGDARRESVVVAGSVFCGLGIVLLEPW